MSNAFHLTAPLPTGRTVLEASAGTGKTYSITGLIVRYIVERGVSVDQFLVVTFTRAAASELRDRTRSVLHAALEALTTGHVPAAFPWMSQLLGGDGDPSLRAERVNRITASLARFDELAITTIHGFCQQSLLQLGLRSGSNTDAVLVENINHLIAEVCRDAIISQLADDPTRLNSPAHPDPRVINPPQAEGELITNVIAALSNSGAAHMPSPPPPPHTYHEHAQRWVELTHRACGDVVERLRLRGEMGYDALVTALQQALLDPHRGQDVANQLAQRYRVVLVDEFQDTDQAQWDIFQRAFGTGILITVGDPKQAIYRFRGADVHAYLDATAGQPMSSLGTNYRSDRALLNGLDTLFRGATLGDRRIAFAAVQARDNAPVSSLDPGAAMQLRMAPHHDSLMASKSAFLAMPQVRSLILADLVGVTIDLLDHTTRTDADGRRHQVQPGDIAVLVPSHADANNVAEAMRRAGIPAVRTRTGSVFQSPAAEQWRVLLAALAQPHHAPSVRAAALGWFLDTDIELVAGSDATLSDLQERCADMADRLRVRGVAAFYDEHKAQGGRGVMTTVLSRAGGERHITDGDHIAELLAQATHTQPTEAGRVLRTLDQLIAASDDRSEVAMRRIDSDARAVQITTIHSAKGLEYPIALVPFSFKARANMRRPHSYITSDGRRALDLASTVAWDAGPQIAGDETTRDDREARRNRTTADSDGDELRLLYVALTRAQHRCVVWWASGQRSTTSALARILLDRDGSDAVANTSPVLQAKRGRNASGFRTIRPAYQDASLDQIQSQLQRLAAASNDTVTLTVMPAQIDARSWSGRDTRQRDSLATASPGSRQRIADPTWARWSFSRLGATAEAVFASQRDSDSAATVPDGGGHDEPAAADDEVIPPPLAPSDTAGQLQLGFGPVAHLAAATGGTRFGTFAHAVLEDFDFSSADLLRETLISVQLHARRDGLELAFESVAAGLVAAIRTPLGPSSVLAGRALADFSPADRLAELNFDFEIGQRFSCGLIGEALLATLPLTDPIRPFAARLAGEFARLDISGWMNGSIDAVLRVGRGSQARFVVVDYKTNRLHTPGATDPVAAYTPPALIAAMEHSRYPLQALIYSVALHRYLRWRLAQEYAPDRHLGGIAYLFVRGMVGPDTPTTDGVSNGVFSWRPPADAILEIDRLFARGRAQ